MEEVLRIVMEALLKAEQKACLRLPVPLTRLPVRRQTGQTGATHRQGLNNNIKRTIKIRNSFPNPKSCLLYTSPSPRD